LVVKEREVLAIESGSARGKVKEKEGWDDERVPLGE